MMFPASRGIDSASLRERIPEEQLTFTFSTSPGPGGQNVNKVSTRATLSFDLAHCPALSEAEKRRICALLPGRITRDGRFRVVSSRFRTQLGNRRAAIERFYELLSDALRPRKQRQATRPTAAARRRRIEEKRRRSRKKRERGASHGWPPGE